MSEAGCGPAFPFNAHRCNWHIKTLCLTDFSRIFRTDYHCLGPGYCSPPEELSVDNRLPPYLATSSPQNKHVTTYRQYLDQIVKRYAGFLETVGFVRMSRHFESWAVVWCSSRDTRPARLAMAVLMRRSSSKISSILSHCRIRCKSTSARYMVSHLCTHTFGMSWLARICDPCQDQSSRHGGDLVDLAPQTKLQVPPNSNMNHYKSVEFRQFLECQAPPFEDFLVTVLVTTLLLFPALSDGGQSPPKLFESPKFLCPKKNLHYIYLLLYTLFKLDKTVQMLVFNPFNRYATRNITAQS